MTVIDMTWVGVGGGIGAVLRWSVGVWVAARYRCHFPLATFLVNISGAFAIGYISTLLSTTWSGPYAEWISPLTLTGLLGGYTTFSSMQLDALHLAEKQKHLLALAYLLFSVLFGLLAAAMGIALARW